MELLLKQIREALPLALHDIKNNRFGFLYADNPHAGLVHCYSSHLRPVIDNLPEYEVYYEWPVAQEDSTPNLQESHDSTT